MSQDIVDCHWRWGYGSGAVPGGASPSGLARSHPISRSWLFRLLARYRAAGYAALEPRSRRPKSCPTRTAPELEQAIVELRAELSQAASTPARRPSPTTSAYVSAPALPGPPSGASSSPKA
jgi:hypothetical protein